MQWEVKSIVETEDSAEVTIRGSYDSLKEVERIMMVMSDMVQDDAYLDRLAEKIEEAVNERHDKQKGEK